MLKKVGLVWWALKGRGTVAAEGVELNVMMLPKGFRIWGLYVCL